MPLYEKDFTDSALLIGLAAPADLRLALEPLLKDIILIIFT
jgi:hypothetical protein